jgi:cullin 1
MSIGFSRISTGAGLSQKELKTEKSGFIPSTPYVNHSPLIKCRSQPALYYQLALVRWKFVFFHCAQNMQQNVTDAVLSLIKQERDGAMIDRDLVKKVIDSFVSLGISESDLNKTSLDFYKEHFEDRFIAATERYYKQESESFFAQGNSVAEYLEVTERRLREEKDRVVRYLQPRTREPLVNKCEYIFIRERMNALR